jgi:hypothetical protein
VSVLASATGGILETRPSLRDPLLSENFLLSSRSAQSSFCELECSEADVCDLTFERLMAEHDAFASTSLAGMAKLLGLVENRLEAMNRMADQYE